MPRLRAYRPGDCLHLDLPQLGLDTDAIILNREIDPGTMTVKLTLMGETPAKHAYALGERSEEHTSELQSLMRISYAVFCLKKKNKENNTSYKPTQYLSIKQQN